MSWEDTYRELAYALHNTIAEKTEGVNHALDALYIVGDITSTQRGSTEAALDLLKPTNDFLNIVWSTVHYEDDLKRLIRKINDFTTNNYGDLTTFVNNIEWAYGCVPYYWAYYSEEGLYDTSEWTVCS